jgi:hypothetical protein
VIRAEYGFSKPGRWNRLKRYTPDPGFSHSFATHPRGDGLDIRTIQELLGHSYLRTAMTCAQVLNKGGNGVRSPADGLTLEEWREVQRDVAHFVLYCILRSIRHGSERRWDAISMWCTTSSILRRSEVGASYTACLQCF